MATAVVFRAPVADTDRRVDDDGGRLETVHQRGGIDVGFERGAGLAHGIGRAVELTLAVVAPAHHRAHRAVDVHQDRGALFGFVLASIFLERVFDRLFRVLLQVDVERQPHHEDALMDRLGQGLDQLLHLVERPVEVVVGRALVAAVDRHRRIAARTEDLALGHEPGLDKIIEHHVGTCARGRQIDMRREFRWRLEQAGQHRRFRQVHVARGLVEVKLRRRVDAESAAAEIGAIEIQLENLVLRQPHFEPERKECFLDLALDGALVGQEQVLGQLLADGRAALHHAAGARIGEHRAEQAWDVDAEMLVKTAILGRERCLDQMIGELVQRDGVIVPDTARADLVAVAVEKGDGEFGLLQPIVVRCFPEGGDGKRQQHQQAACSYCQRFRRWFDEVPAPPARDVEAIHEYGEALIKLARPGLGLVHPEVDARVDIEKKAAQPYLPAVPVLAAVEEISQGTLGAAAQPTTEPNCPVVVICLADHV